MEDIITTEDVSIETVNVASPEAESDKPICNCPICEKGVYERKNKEGKVIGYFCEDRGCLKMWKNNYFLDNHHINLDRGIAIALLTDKRIKLPAIYFSKKDTTYPATLIVDFVDKKCRYSFQF